MVIVVDAERTSISLGLSPNEDSIHLEIGEDRDAIHHLYIGQLNNVHIHMQEATQEGEENQFVIKINQ